MMPRDWVIEEWYKTKDLDRMTKSLLSFPGTIEPPVYFTLTPSVAFKGSHSTEPPIFVAKMGRGSKVHRKDGKFLLYT